MSMLRQKVEHEIDVLDNRSMAAVYEHLRLLNTMRRPPQKRRQALPDIEEILRLTASSKSNWSEGIVSDREERQ